VLLLFLPSGGAGEVGGFYIIFYDVGQARPKSLTPETGRLKELPQVDEMGSSCGCPLLRRRSLDIKIFLL